MTFRDQGNKRFPADLRKEIWDLAELFADTRAGGSDPTQQNLLGWSMDPQVASGNSVIGGGVEYLTRVVPVRDGTVKNVTLGLHSVGVTLTSGQCFAGLRDRSGNLLGKTVSQHTNWASGLFEKKMALDVPVDVLGGVPVYVVFVANGSTLPGFARLSTSDVINAGCIAGQGRSMYSGGGLTDLPASVSMPGLNMTNVVGWWAAIS
jgi:hypothetical protein